ncbi:MAG: OsmC family peroxiredoxin [Spirochaetaceae bacterium]|nr:MAG: OsmC family peroxiredoxin [Spirochaetaceae bacterium]
MGYDTRAVLKSGMAFDIEQHGHHLTADADASHGGTGYGPSPRSLMLSALSGCTGMDVVAILGKMQMPYDSFALEISATGATEHPHVFTEVHIKYLFTGSEVDTAKVEKAVKLSLEKYCPVAATLKHTATITWEVVVS